MPTARTSPNKAALRRLADATNSHNPELISQVFDEVFAPDVKAGTPMPIESNGAEGAKQVFAILHRAFPDMHITIEDLIEEGDKVVIREKITGTHLGEYMGLQPTGRSVAYNEIAVARFADRRIVEFWGVVDMFSLMRQLDPMPAAFGQPPAGESRETAAEPEPSRAR
jgi:predicted ester cyclase